MEVFLSKQRWKGKSRGTWNDAIMVNESRHGYLGGWAGKIEGRDDNGPEKATLEPPE
jgi:hypothetical protein